MFCCNITRYQLSKECFICSFVTTSVPIPSHPLFSKFKKLEFLYNYSNCILPPLFYVLKNNCQKIYNLNELYQIFLFKKLEKHFSENFIAQIKKQAIPAIR
ncbi:conserved hypothetical protein [Bacillus mycoides]|uniref:Uncharacterized protein n=1 Tax=Bacillus mycoides TaxID=1405 RepID=A0A653W9D0_BACMY|nr:conserved hypothetical protein [Bacillus mycoides]